MRTLALGEILWDIIEGNAHLGGAPFNLTAHLSKLGAKTFLVSAVGNDQLGREALAKAADLHVDTRLVSTLPDRPTGAVVVELLDGQPGYTIIEEVAWDAIQLDAGQWKLLQSFEWDVVVFGTLAQRSKSNQVLYGQIFESIRAKEVFYDINFRKDYYSKKICETSLQYASMLKLNDEEVGALSKLIYGRELAFEPFCERTALDFDIHTICITRGADGALVFSRKNFYDIAGIKVKVADTVGAGDSFSAAFLYTFHQTGNAGLAAEKGCRLGAYVASCEGAIPEYDQEISALFQ